MYKFNLFILVIYCSLLSESLVFPPYGHSYGIRKATPKHLFMFFGPRTSFDDPQGLATTRLESWDNPSTEKDDDEVVVYGVNSGKHQIIYNTSMWGLGLYGKEGSGKDCFYYPKGIAADPYGNVIVADSGNDRIVHLFNPKSKLQWKAAYSAKTEKDPGLKGPSRVALDEDGTMYVTDQGNNRIVVLSKDGSVKRYIPAHDRFSFTEGPTALACADGAVKWSFYRSERVLFCADEKGRRLWKLGIDGTVIKTVSMPGGYRANYSAIDYYHNLWVTDVTSHCVLKFDNNLNLLDIFGTFGTGDNQFTEPRGITIYKRYGQVFIAERKGAQYYWIGTDLKSQNLRMRAPGICELTIQPTEHSFISLFSLANNDTLFFLKRRMVHPGKSSIIVPDPYSKTQSKTFTLKIEPTYSSYTYNAWYYPVTLQND